MQSQYPDQFCVLNYRQSQYPDQFGVPPLQGFSTTPRSFYGQSMQQQQQQQHQQQQQMYAQTTPRGYMPIEIQHMSHDMHSVSIKIVKIN